MKKQGVALLLLVLGLAVGLSSDVILDESQLATVDRVIDGDTIELSTGERVRYIGIDTPETVHPSKPVEYYGKEASEFNKRLVEGKQVRLEFDIQLTDKYGRTLAYVYLMDGTFVNAELVKQGYARVSTYPPNVKHTDEFLSLEREARGGRRGLWQGEDAEERPKCYPDVNCDGVVDLLDLVLVGLHIGEVSPNSCDLAYCEEELARLMLEIDELKATIAELESENGKSDDEVDLPDPNDDVIVYITNTRECYHRGWCGSLWKSKIPIKKSDAIRRGYRACQKCKP